MTGILNSMLRSAAMVLLRRIGGELICQFSNPERPRAMTSDLESILSMVDRVTEPPKMSKSQALAFLEQIETEIEFRVEALREEMRDDE